MEYSSYVKTPVGGTRDDNKILLEQTESFYDRRLLCTRSLSALMYIHKRLFSVVPERVYLKIVYNEPQPSQLFNNWHICIYYCTSRETIKGRWVAHVP